MGYQGEAELVLHILQTEGIKPLYTTCTSDSEYYKIECDGLTIKDIAYNLWNLEDSLLVVRTAKGERGWLRFVFGNSWGELVNDYTTNLFPRGHEPRYTPLSKGYDNQLYEYMDWSVEDVTEAFGLGRLTLCDLLANYSKPDEVCEESGLTNCATDHCGTHAVDYSGVDVTCAINPDLEGDE